MILLLAEIAGSTHLRDLAYHFNNIIVEFAHHFDLPHVNGGTFSNSSGGSGATLERPLREVED